MGEQKTVLVDLKSSVEVGGTMYHPNSQGVRMPVNHAKAIGATIKKEVKETSSKSSDKETSEKKGSKKSDESVEEADKSEEEIVEGPQDQSSESSVSESEEPAADKAEKQVSDIKQVADLPVDDDILEKLLADERFSSMEALVENQDQLTDVNGIGPATAKTIVEALG
jgi:antitoxin component of MazEF toxin-antitoxin module